MTTKEQERKALAKIEAIIKELGENSYVATAMEGMIADAKQNIDNDWACSMADRYFTELKKNQQLETEVKALRDLKQEQGEIIEELRQRAERAEDNMLTRFQIGELMGVIEDSRYDNDSERVNSAKAIVKYADDPSSREFKDAVAMNRAAEARIRKLENLIQVLIKKEEAAIK